MKDHIGKVFPFKTFSEYILFLEFQFFLYVDNHFICGSGCQGKYRCIIDKWPDLRNIQIRWPEVVSPLRDAMCLIDGQQAYIHTAQVLPEGGRFKPFRGDIQELQVPEDTVIDCNVDLTGMHSRMHGRSLDPSVFQVLNLVFHQSYQGGDHHAYPFHSQGGHLETDRFSTTRGKQGQGITSVENRLYDIFLHWTEGRISPVLNKYVVDLHQDNFRLQLRS